MDNQLKTIIKELELVIPRVEQTLDNKQLINQLKDTGEQLVKLYKKLGPVGTDIESIFKKFQLQNEIKIELEKLNELLGTDVMQGDLILSETFAKDSKKQMNSLSIRIAKVSYDKPPEIRIEDASTILDLHRKYPLTNELFISTLNGAEYSPIVEKSLEFVKAGIFQDNTKPKTKQLSSNPLENLIQRYKLQFVSLSSTISDLIANAIGVKNVKYSQLQSVAKSKKVFIIYIADSSAVTYNEELLSNTYDGKSGISTEFNNNTMTITRTDNVKVAPELTLFHPKGKIDLLKERKYNKPLDLNDKLYNEIYRDITGENCIIIQYNGTQYRHLKCTLSNILHILNGPNRIISQLNDNMEQSIIEHFTGPKEIKWSSTHTPVAHIRLKMRNEMLKLIKTKKVKNREQLDTILNSDDIIKIYNDQMFKAFQDHKSKHKLPVIVYRESITSYLSDINIRNRRFKRELNNLYSKSDITFDNKETHLLELEKILDEVLALSISEKDNIFNTIDEKRILFQR